MVLYCLLPAVIAAPLVWWLCVSGVMLFCLGRAECPVDTHVWEISKQVGCTGNSVLLHDCLDVFKPPSWGAKAEKLA